MNIKWLGRKSHSDTNNLQVRGSSAGGREECVFRVKNRVTYDLRCPTVWLSNGVSPGIKKNSPVLQPIFRIFRKPHRCRFLGTGSDVNPHHCRYTTVGSKSGSEGGF